MFFVLEGKAVVIQEKQEVLRYRPGNFFAEAATVAVGEWRSSIPVVAVMRTKCLRISKETYDSMLLKEERRVAARKASNPLVRKSMADGGSPEKQAASKRAAEFNMESHYLATCAFEEPVRAQSYTATPAC
jgi:hypothetical protein